MNRADEWTHFATGAIAAIKPQTARGLTLQENRDEIHAIAYVAAAIADNLLHELDRREKRGDFD